MFEDSFVDIVDGEPDAGEWYGTARHSGRYPWGSGKNPQRNKNFMTTYNDLKKQGLTDKEIAAAMRIKDSRGKTTVNALNAAKARAVADIRKDNQAKVVKLKEKGYSWVAIAKELNLSGESLARKYYNDAMQGRQEAIDVTGAALKAEVSQKKIIDVGPGAQYRLGVTKTRMDTTVADLVSNENYNRYVLSLTHPGMKGHAQKYTLLAAPDVTYQDAWDALKNAKIGEIGTHVEKDSEGNYKKYNMETPTSVDPSRVYVKYKEDGGEDRDGMIGLRRGVEDISLGESHYAQVRIAVNGDHYLKGMAVYDDDIPKGYDIVVYSNKKKGTPLLGDTGETSVAKPMKSDPEDPFGSSVVQHHYTDKNGKEKLSALNIIGSTEEDEHKEGSWDQWSKQISAQFLSKQDPKLAKRQLDKTYKEKQEEFDEINSLTNPIVKRKLLEDFANQCDSDATTLKAAGFSRQRTQVILPFPDIKENQIYAPNYNTGEQVALVRFPHAGTFEIPTLTVNNNVSVGSAYKTIKDAKDAVGIHPKTAKILSGADFDGDTVVVIPLTGNNLKTRRNTQISESLASIQDFDPKQYQNLKLKEISERTKGTQMGIASNLITDMTIKGANADELARAAKYSMVVIDAKKHKLDYKQAEKDFNIQELKELYQQSSDPNKKKAGGAGTLISRAKSKEVVDERKYYSLSKSTVDSEGNKIYKNTNRTDIKVKDKDPNTGETIWRYKRKGDDLSTLETKVVKRTTDSTKMAEAKDAMELLSGPNHEGTQIERVYGTYANRMKDLAKKARLAYVNTQDTTPVKNAKTTYASEVQSLNAKLYKYESESDYERKAIAIATKVISSQKASWESDHGEEMDKADYKKLKGRALRSARESVYPNGKRYKPDITQKEWDAIQAGAISKTKAKKLIDAADEDLIKSYATPRKTQASTLSASRKSQIKSMKASGATAAEIADALGTSVTTVYTVLNG